MGSKNKCGWLMKNMKSPNSGQNHVTFGSVGIVYATDF